MVNLRQPNFKRRDFCAIAGSAVTSVVLGSACRRIGGSEIAGDGRLTARPRTDVKTSSTGQIMLGLNQERDAVLQVPKSAGGAPLPLLVMLHGATQSSEDM